MKFQIPLMNPWKDVLVHVVLWAALLTVPSVLFSFFPKPDFDAVLKSQYPHQIAVVVGGKSGFGGSETYSRRSYLLLSSVFADPKFVQIMQVNSESPKVVVQSGNRSSFLIALLIFIGFNFYYFRKRWRARLDDA